MLQDAGELGDQPAQLVVFLVVVTVLDVVLPHDLHSGGGLRRLGKGAALTKCM